MSLRVPWLSTIAVQATRLRVVADVELAQPVPGQVPGQHHDPPCGPAQVVKPLRVSARPARGAARARPPGS